MCCFGTRSRVLDPLENGSILRNTQPSESHNDGVHKGTFPCVLPLFQQVGIIQVRFARVGRVDDPIVSQGRLLGEVLSYGRKVVECLNTQCTECCVVANSRIQENMGCSDGTCREDDLFRSNYMLERLCDGGSVSSYVADSANKLVLTAIILCELNTIEGQFPVP